jgi:WD40 repeat protein
MEIIRWPLEEKGHSKLHSVCNDVVFQSALLVDQRYAICSTRGRLAVVDESGELRNTLSGHSQHVLCVETLNDETTLVSGGADASLRVWDATTGKLLRTLSNHTAAVRDLAARPVRNNLPMLASASADKTVRLWQPTMGRLVRFARLPSAPLAIAWTPDGRCLLAACEDGHLRVIDPDSVEILADKPAIDGWAYAVAASPDGRQAVIAGENGQIRAIAVGD